MTPLTDLKLQNDRVEQAIAHMTDILLLIRTERQPERKELLWQIYQQARLQMNLESSRLNDLIDQLQFGYKERKEMKRVSVLAGILAVLLLMFAVGFAAAQDTPLAPTNTTQVIEGTATLVSSEPIATEVPAATVEPPVMVEQPGADGSRVLDFIERVLPWIVGIGIVVVIVVGILGRELIVNLGRSSPVFAREAAISGGESVLGSLEEYTKTTTTTIDDAGVAELRKFFREIVAEIRAEAKPDQPPGIDQARMLAQFKAYTDADEGRLNEPARGVTPPVIPDIPSPDPWKQQYPIDGEPGQQR